MKTQNSSYISKLITAFLLFISFVGCKQREFSIVNTIKCNAHVDLRLAADSLSFYFSQSESFFSIREKGTTLFIEPFKIENSYKDKGVVDLFYDHSNKIFLVDEKITDLNKLDPIVIDKLWDNLNAFGIDKNNFNVENKRLDVLSSTLMFGISDYSKGDTAINKNQSYSMLYLLKRLNCSINNARDKMSRELYSKDYSSVTKEEMKTIKKIVPKIYYLSYFKNHKETTPVTD